MAEGDASRAVATGLPAMLGKARRRATMEEATLSIRLVHMGLRMD